MSDPSERRRHDRFTTPPMYSAVYVQVPGDSGPARIGHAYNVCEGGLRFELDDAIPEGMNIELSLDLPPTGALQPGLIAEPKTISVRANVIWQDDDEGLGPVRMAVAFTSFASEQDHEVLVQHLGSGRLARAA